LAKSFVRKLVVACAVFLFITLLVRLDWPFTRPLQNYVSYVVVTDFSLQPVLQKIPFLEKMAAWDVKSLIQALPGR